MSGASNLPLISRGGQQLSESTDCSVTRSITEIKLDLSRKHITGQEATFFFGENAAVGTTYEDIWPTGGDIPWQTTASTVSVYSSHAADTSAGLGVRSIEIHGLSATGADQDEVIIMNGTTEVDSALSYIRITKMHNETVGTYGGSHQGTVTLRVTSGSKSGAIMSVMTGDEGAADSSVQYGSGEAQNGFYSVPLGKVAYITHIQVVPNIGTNKSVDVGLYEREGITTVSAPFLPRRILWHESGVDLPVDKHFDSYIKIKALTDFWFRAKGSAESKVEVYCDFYLLDQDASGA